MARGSRRLDDRTRARGLPQSRKGLSAKRVQGSLLGRARPLSRVRSQRTEGALGRTCAVCERQLRRALGCPFTDLAASRRAGKKGRDPVHDESDTGGGLALQPDSSTRCSSPVGVHQNPGSWQSLVVETWSIADRTADRIYEGMYQWRSSRRSHRRDPGPGRRLRDRAIACPHQTSAS